MIDEPLATIGAACADGHRVRLLDGPAPVLPLDPETQSAPRLIVDRPVESALSRGLVVIQYRAENLRIVPVYGPNALSVSPRIGHIHVTIDDAPWHWADASGDPLIIQGLPSGRHLVRIDLVDADHRQFDHAVVKFEILEAVHSPANASPAGS